MVVPSRLSRRAARPRLVVVDAVEPVVDGGRFPAKGVVGDPVAVEVVMFSHGHEEIGGRLLVVDPAGNTCAHDLEPVSPGDDLWGATFTPDRPGSWSFTVEAWPDDYRTWRRGYDRLVAAGLAGDLDRRDGAALVEVAATRAPTAEARTLVADARALRVGPPDAGTLARLDATMAAWPDRTDATRSEPFPLDVDRPRAACSAWYELFPRSASPDPSRPGTLRDVVDRLDYVAALGFDVLYLPPIHPVGTTNRKGRNNATTARPGEPGSPWAIGSEAGGHTAVDPALGTVDDFVALVAAARDRGIEVALDLAFQCSPDHPWVRDHPEWFLHRSDGSVRYAENPPKRYEDVLPLDLAGPAWQPLWEACLEVVRTWIARGVRIFRVDNPHTKPFAFWAWIITEVRATDPDVLFLAEAFTRPAVMAQLAKLGFDQSYTYFTWRTERWEIVQYLTELTRGPARRYMRPNFWPNTPDILPAHLQRGGPAAFVTRLVLAAGLAANYGIYGPVFELGIDAARAPGAEEYLDSEKYEVHHWDLEDPGSLAPVVARMNRIRRSHSALRRDANLRFHPTDNDRLLCWSKGDPAAETVVLCIANLDHAHAQSGWTDLDLAALGVEPDRPFTVTDLLADTAYRWYGGRNFVRLDPDRTIAHVFAIGRPEDAR